jgi:phosphoribosyl 1,2-cyclic phosphodiesterase/DNA-binding response OmpR family regulator
MRVRFWGTRGSIAKPGRSTIRYGGNTSCVEVRSAAGTLVVLDCGTGAHGLGQALLAASTQPIRGHLLISHTHWDHIQGVPFFAPLFVPGGEWDVYAPRGFAQSLRETLAGQMQYAYFPITLEQFGATIRYHELVEGNFRVGDVDVRAQYLNHPALTLGYRLEADGASMVYASDHEPFARDLAAGEGTIAGEDGRHADFLAGADLVIHDAQFTAEEYPAKVGWGHSSVEYAVAVSRRAGVRRLALTHHDPLRDDDALDRLVAAARVRAGATPDVFAATEGEVIELEARASYADGQAVDGLPPADAPPAFGESGILLGTANTAAVEAVCVAAGACGVRVARADDAAAAVDTFAHEEQALVVLGRTLPDGGDGLDACRAIRASGATGAADVPVVVVAAARDAAAGAAAGVTDWLIEPFSVGYARTRVQAWLLRTPCRWVPAALPVDEEERLAALHALNVLDTPPEERFDRLTRLAAALFDVPIALVSLVDRHRQWLKSCHGVPLRETSREVSFCAHAIHDTDITVVPDALLDPRFADNPTVTDGPRIRFYAGFPLVMPGGQCVGTLCVVDTRPRQLDEAGLRLLKDLGNLVRQELVASANGTPEAKPVRETLLA